jgi:hypothetical protein
VDAGPADPRPGDAGDRPAQPGEVLHTQPTVEPEPARPEPRVTTWAEDLEHATATGEWPAVDPTVALAASVSADAEAGSQPPVEPPAGRRRAGRRRRRRNEDPVPVAAEPAIQAAVEPDVLESVVHAVEPDDVGDDVPDAFPTEAPARTEMPERTREQWLADERAEAERIDAERRAAQLAEDERLAQLGTAAVESEEPPLDQPQLEAQEPSLDVDEHWLEAERGEAERIDAERAAAQQAEDERLEKLRADEFRQRAEAAARAESDRLQAVRAAAEQAERERLAALRSEEYRLRAENDRPVAETAPTQAPEEPAAPSAVDTGPAPTATPTQTPTQTPAQTPTQRPTQTPAQRSTAPARTTEPVPRFVEFRATSVLRYVFGAFFVVFAVAAVIAIFRAVSPGDSSLVMAAAGLTALAMLSWWALLSWTPPIVSVSDGTLEIARGTKATSWDLRDPRTEITFRGRPSSRAWRAVVRDQTGRSAAIAARQVDPAQFVELVEHYQALGRS